MTDIDTLINEVQRLDREATPGPWAPQVISHQWTHIPCGPPYEGPSTDRRGMEGTAHDARLIAHYRTAAPLLAAEVQRLRAEVASLRQGWQAEREAARGTP